MSTVRIGRRSSTSRGALVHGEKGYVAVRLVSVCSLPTVALVSPHGRGTALVAAFMFAVAATFQQKGALVRLRPTAFGRSQRSSAAPGGSSGASHSSSATPFRPSHSTTGASRSFSRCSSRQSSSRSPSATGSRSRTWAGGRFSELRSSSPGSRSSRSSATRRAVTTTRPTTSGRSRSRDRRGVRRLARARAES